MNTIDSIYEGTAYLEGWKYSGQPVHTCLSVRDSITKAYNAALEEAAKVVDPDGHVVVSSEDQSDLLRDIAEAIRKLKVE
jgi:hypothetical protein